MSLRLGSGHSNQFLHNKVYKVCDIVHTIFILEAENEGDKVLLIVLHASPFALKRSLG